ncbi:MAG: acetolactate synthase small subunit [Planctomycetota bacterium]|jgi:acetolactate synthase-1/3 small subunit
MKHILSALVLNKPGVLAHVAGMFAARAFNIDSLAVGRTDDPAISRMTIVVVGDDKVVEQVRKQLIKIVEVVKVILAIIEMFNGKVVDIGPKFVMVEVAGPENKIEAFIDSCRPYGIKNLVRTGTVAMSRYNRTAKTEE